MGLQQATKQERVEQTGAAGKSKIGLAGRAKKVQSKESESQEGKDATECEKTNWREMIEGQVE